jgi:hypothetical protein
MIYVALAIPLPANFRAVSFIIHFAMHIVRDSVTFAAGYIELCTTSAIPSAILSIYAVETELSLSMHVHLTNSYNLCFIFNVIYYTVPILTCKVS